MQNTIANLVSKGVNITEIEKQTKSTADNIAIIEAQIEQLPLTKDALIIQYEEEKELQLKMNVDKDYVKDRELENKNLFVNDHLNGIIFNVEKKITQSTVVYSGAAVEQNRFASRR